MPDKKALIRTFETELRSLPIQLVPPDPARPLPALDSAAGQPTACLPPPAVLDKLIQRIKRL